MKNKFLFCFLLMFAALATATAQPRPQTQPTNDGYNHEQWCPDEPVTVTWASVQGFQTSELPRPAVLWRVEVTDKLTITAYDNENRPIAATVRPYRRLTVDWTTCATPYSLRTDDGLAFFGSRD